MNSLTFDYTGANILVTGGTSGIGNGIANAFALRRFGTPDEVAEVLAFCNSDKASYLTGIDVLCDGISLASLSCRGKLAMARQT